jgi:sugar lactone lactonase YvrE
VQEQTLNIEALTSGGDTLGEGPHWDVETGRLLRVDIKSMVMHSTDPATGTDESTTFEDEVAFVIPRAGGGLVLGAPGGVRLVDADGTVRDVAEISSDFEHHRTNDAKCDSRGRLWFGTWSPAGESGIGGLYRYADDVLTQVVDGISIGNGIGWSPDDTRMYLVDSGEQRIDVWDFDAERGELSGRRPFVEVPAAEGLPDGLTVDADGGVWLALFGGGVIRRYTPDGQLEREVPLPTSNPTSATFGSAGLEDLYVTTATAYLTDEQLADQKAYAGAVLRLQPGVAGLPVAVFAG